MIRLLGVLLLASVMAAASYVYNVKNEAERLTRRSTELSREMEREREMIGILRAEWAHLNQPQRLQSLAERHLRDMRPQNVAALALPHEVPQRPMDLGVFIASIEREGGIRLAPLPAPVPRAQPPRPVVQTARAPSPPPERVQRAQTYRHRVQLHLLRRPGLHHHHPRCAHKRQRRRQVVPCLCCLSRLVSVKRSVSHVR
jgi:hypothetical protein